MSVFKSQYTRALKVIPSDQNNVPSPNVLVQGVQFGSFPNSIIANPETFTNADGTQFYVNVGDIVYNITTSQSAIITEVVDNFTVNISEAIMNSSDEYIIYQSSSTTGPGNEGCYLYIGVNNVEVTVTTIGGDIVQFRGLSRGTVLPVQVIKVHSSGTDATEIIALW